MPEGSIYITTLSLRPPVYGVTFVPYKGTMTRLWWRECSSLEEVRGLLEHAGVVLDAIASALRSAHQGHATSIRKVVLDEAALERLGLRAPEQPGST